jgi:glycosyltransferase involved in cell wall biosynthesis
MRVGIICDAFAPENKAVAIRLYHIAISFQKNGISTYVHTSTRESIPAGFKTKKNFFGAPDNRSSNILRLLSEVWLGAELFLRILFCNYSLIIITSPPFITSFIAACGAIIKGIPFVFDVRDEYPEVFFSAGVLNQNSFAGKVLLRLEKAIYKNAFCVTTVTEGIVERIKLKQPGANVKLVRNGFDEELFKPSENKEDVFTVIFHGNIGKFQRPELIVELAKLASNRGLNVQFKVIGWGNNDDVLKSCSLTNLAFYGMIEHAQIPAIVSKAHVGISFRSSDTISINSFPVKLYEYIGVGLPMIVVPISEAGKFVADKNLGFQFSGESVSDILDKIVELNGNPSTLRSLTNNVVSIRKEFSRQVISQSLVTELLHRLKSN